MQVLLHAAKDTDGSSAMAEHLRTVVHHTLDRFGDRVTSVEAHLSSVSGTTRLLHNDVHCLITARLRGQESVVVNEQAHNAHRAIAGAMHKLKSAVDTAIAKHLGNRQPLPRNDEKA
jgi:ribosome-associated translation inhibitor RaiA